MSHCRVTRPFTGDKAATTRGYDWKLHAPKSCPTAELPGLARETRQPLQEVMTGNFMPQNHVPLPISRSIRSVRRNSRRKHLLSCKQWCVSTNYYCSFVKYPLWGVPILFNVRTIPTGHRAGGQNVSPIRTFGQTGRQTKTNCVIV